MLSLNKGDQNHVEPMSSQVFDIIAFIQVFLPNNCTTFYFQVILSYKIQHNIAVILLSIYCMYPKISDINYGLTDKKSEIYSENTPSDFYDADAKFQLIMEIITDKSPLIKYKSVENDKTLFATYTPVRLIHRCDLCTRFEGICSCLVWFNFELNPMSWINTLFLAHKFSLLLTFTLYYSCHLQELRGV